jgi:hypothetical protein
MVVVGGDDYTGIAHGRFMPSRRADARYASGQR